ncbi:MAG: S9 family peptidase [Phycisphaeraceae bacterium]|nr:MAG: S9 family peptidase [Phycisphaeraceae bacterium]
MTRPMRTIRTPLFAIAAVGAAALLLSACAHDRSGRAGDRPAASQARADATSPMRQRGSQTPTIEQFMKIRAPNSPALAPDGSLYVRDWPDGVNQLYRRAPGAAIDAPMERLTDFEDGLGSYALSPDGGLIILSAAIGGSEQNDLHLLDASSGEITTLYSDPDVVYSFQTWMRDGSGFIYTANDDSRSDFHIYRFDLASGDSQKLLGERGSWSVSDITDDGTRLLVGRYFSIADARAYELQASTGELRDISIDEGPTFNRAVGYLPGERAVAILSDAEEGSRRLFVRDLRSDEVRKPLPDLDRYELDGATISHERDFIAVTANIEGYGKVTLHRLPNFAAATTPPIEEGVVGSVRIRDRNMTWVLNNARSPGIAYSWRIDSRAMPRQITQADTQGIDLDQFPLPELIRFESFDGLEIPAFIYTPPGHRAGRAIPFIVIYHGGPESQARPTFNAQMQYFLSRGFGVMVPNVRGSTGYGREFHQLDNYKGRWDSVRDGVGAAQWLVDNGYSEPGRIAAYGGSYGGFMACATIIEASGTGLYGASVNIVGIVNFQTFLEQTRSYRRKLREAEYGPLSDPEFLASISPINFIDKIDVPMFIAHGLNDPRVPVGEAMQLAVGLKQRGHTPEQLYFHDEGHGFAKLENRLLFAERVARFLDEHIGR